jgi:hypothetical protein
MPRRILEVHLTQLHEALVQAKPDQADRYDRLLQGAAGLAAERRRTLSDDDLSELTQRFDQLVDPQESRDMPGAGGLIRAPVADEAAGIGRAVDSLIGWLTDADRFSERWVAAVEQVLRDAREEAAASGAAERV